MRHKYSGFALENTPDEKACIILHDTSGICLSGLPVGRYELSIDGESVGVYSSTQLSRHIELQANSKTPQYQQALKVAELNKQRNAGPVKSLRNEWRTFQQYSRLIRNPTEDENVQKRIAVLKKQLEGREGRISKHEQDARDLEDRIFEINQPEPRKYVLKKAARK